MNREVYSYLLKSFGRKPGYWVGVVALIIQTLLLRVVSVLVIAHLAAAIARGDLHSARVSVVVQVCVSLSGLGFRLLKDMVVVKAENDAYGDLMVAYYRRLVGKDMSFYRDNQTGYLASTFRQHADSCMEIVRLFRGELIQTPISLTIPAVVLFFASWKVGLVTFAIVIVQVIYVLWSSSIVNTIRTRSHEIYRQVSGIVSDDVTNIVAYKTAGSSTNAVARLRALADEETATFYERRKRLALLDAPRDTITILGTGVAFWIIVSSSHNSAQAVGLTILAVTYLFQIFNSIGTLPDLIVRHDDLITKIYPTLDYLKSDKYERIKDKPSPVELVPKGGRIDFNNITFSYNEGKNAPNVFHKFDLHIKPGEQVGVVGLSGAGKSTLASLLMRFDEVQGGSICVDGVDIRDVRQEDLRRQIAYVPQEPLLFHRTIKENLQYFGRDMSEAHMLRAAKAAHAHEFITQLSQGYDTLVGERGVKLSGGQKQRVVIARAILKDAPIMLFDEATSALDSESEKIIQEALPAIIGKRTAIVIAHRLSTIAGLDRVIVMQDGRIIEDGTHAQLLKLKGRYYSLWQKQTAKKSAPLNSGL